MSHSVEKWNGPLTAFLLFEIFITMAPVLLFPVECEFLHCKARNRKENKTHTHKLFCGFRSYYFKWSGSEVGLKWNIPLASGTDGHFWMRFCPLVVERDVHFDSLACLHYHPSVKMALILTKKKKTVVCQVPEVLGVWHMYTFLKVFSRIKKKKKRSLA